MAKEQGYTDPNKRELYKYPSRFGSHATMINTEATKELNNECLVVLTDEFGDYTTERNRLDSGIADPNRYAEDRIGKLFAGREAS